MSTTELAPTALQMLPIFPLPRLVLLPGSFLSLHIFEPRYRTMIAHIIEGHRLLAISMADESGAPDPYGRPPIHPVAGVGLLRRSAQLPDGRYNIVLEGIGRVNLAQEHPPEQVYRIAQAQLLEETLPEDTKALSLALSGMRALATQALLDAPETLEQLQELDDPGRVTDVLASAIMSTPAERQQALETLELLERIQLVTGALGAKLLEREIPNDEDFGWGVKPAKA